MKWAGRGRRIFYWDIYLFDFFNKTVFFRILGYPTTDTENPESGVDVEKVVLYPKENAGTNHTEKYELVTEQNIAVVRRAAMFNVAIKTKSRGIDLDHDNVNLIFEFGKK